MKTQRLLAVLVLIILLGFAIRISALDVRALWFDEGNTLTYATMPLDQIAAFKKLWTDSNPPAYQVMLGRWMLLTGVTAFNARLFSVFAGLVAVPLTFAIGKRLATGHITPLVGAGLMSILPMQVYYSREAKAYTFLQVLLLALILIYLCRFNKYCALRRVSWIGLWIIVATIIGLAVGSHYLSVLMIGTINLWLALRLSRAHREGELRRMVFPSVIWIAAHAAGGLAWVPYLTSTFSEAVTGAEFAATEGLPLFNPANYLSDSLSEFAAGPTRLVPVSVVVTIVFVLTTLYGVRCLNRGTKRLILVSWIVVPFISGYLVQFPILFFFPRFLLFTLSGWVLLIGVGYSELVQLYPRMSITGLAAFAALCSSLLGSQQARPPVQPDLRPVAEALAQHLRPGDAVLYSYSWQPGMLNAYLPESSDLAYFATYFQDRDTALTGVMEDHHRIWLLTWGIGAEDPNNDYGQWLLNNAASPGRNWYGENQLGLFINPEAALNSGEQQRCVTFNGESIELCFAPIAPETTALDVVTINLFWRTEEIVENRYSVFVHLVGDSSSPPVSNRDGEPVNGTAPTNVWIPGEIIQDSRAVLVPLEFVGTLEVRVGLYDPQASERLPLDEGGDSVLIGEVNILARP